MGGWDDPIQRGLITVMVFEDDPIVNVKGYEKRGCGTCFWMMNENACTSRPWMLYEDMESLTNLGDYNTNNYYNFYYNFYY